MRISVAVKQVLKQALRLVVSVRAAFSLVFARHLVIRRVGRAGRLRVLFEERRVRAPDGPINVPVVGPGGRAARAPAPARRPGSAELIERDRMLCELRQLLDQLPGTRAAMRHLAFVEHVLGSRGIAAVERLPKPVLSHALDQIEGLVLNWSAEGLAALRSRMSVACRSEVAEASEAAEAGGAPAASMLTAQETLVQPPSALAEPASGFDDLAALNATYASVGLRGEDALRT